jgi:hypothetical protein
MIDLGHPGDLRALKALLEKNHRVDVIIQFMDLSHNHLSDQSDRLMGGQVNIDITASTTRSATLDLRDPENRLKLDDNAPSDGSLFFTKMFRIIFVVSPPDNSVHYSVPIFTGPISKVTRSGPIVSVECQGKESLSFATIWAGRTLKKGIKKTEAILKVMGWTGETRFNFTPKDSRIGGSGISAARTRKFTFWALAKMIAGSMNLQLFYDGRGVLRLRRIPAHSVYTFEDDGVMVTIPQVNYEVNDEFCNAVEIIGGKPKGSKKKVKYRLVAPRHHPLSPWNIGRNGTPRFVPKIIEDDSIKSHKIARARARRELQNALLESVEVTFDSLPVPMLEELDNCRYRSSDAHGTFRLKQMSIPLTVDATSSIGYLKNVKPRIQRTRRRRRHHH